MDSTNTEWPLDPHTRGKHLVLKGYLDAWFPILGYTNSKILFIDGFAGPGRYEGGEPGSPLVALDAWRRHQAQGRIPGAATFIFIEKRPDRAAALKRVVDGMRVALPPKTEVVVHNGAFDATMSDALDSLASQLQILAPAFVMVDPFGVSDTPMSVLGKILANRKSELYVSFMYEAINRFKTTPEFEKHLDALFGTPRWRDGIDIADGSTRKAFLYDLYEAQLKAAGAKYVVRFELYEGNRLVYAIFFATGNLKGCDKMKEAIWKVAPFGDFAFRGTRSDQLVALFQAGLEPLQLLLCRHFGARGWVRIEEVEEFMSSDQTDYYTGQLRKGALVPLEEAGFLVVKDGTRKKRKTHPTGCILRFTTL